MNIKGKEAHRLALENLFLHIIQEKARVPSQVLEKRCGIILFLEGKRGQLQPHNPPFGTLLE